MNVTLKSGLQIYNSLYKWIQETQNNHILIFRYATEYALHDHFKNIHTTAPHHMFVFVLRTGDIIV